MLGSSGGARVMIGERAALRPPPTARAGRRPVRVTRYPGPWLRMWSEVSRWNSTIWT